MLFAQISNFSVGRLKFSVGREMVARHLLWPFEAKVAIQTGSKLVRSPASMLTIRLLRASQRA